MLGELGSRAAKALITIRGILHSQYAAPGYLLYARDRTLVAHPFDPDALRLKGEPIPVAAGVARSYFGLTGFSASGSGALAFRASSAGDELLWLDRAGKKVGTLGEPGEYSNPALSLDEKRLAVGRVNPGATTRDLWVFDLVRGASTRLTLDPADDFGPTWSPDGTRIAFSSDRNGVRQIFAKRADGSGDDELLLASKEAANVEDWSPDGRFLIFNHNSSNIFLLPLSSSGERRPIPLQATEAVENQGQFAPNGRWIAYCSNESGRSEVYVRGFSPDGLAAGGKSQVSTAGGLEPQWRRDGKEIFYLSGSGSTLVAVDVKIGGVSFEAGSPKPLFEVRLAPLARRNRYVASRDGQRFLTVAPPEGGTVPITVVLNWTAGLPN